MKNAEIDWTEAPEWATVRLQHTHNSRMFAWAERYLSNVRFVRDDVAPMVYSRLDPAMWVVLAERPQPWTGTGLPPVGIGCEASWDSGDNSYHTVRILAHDGDLAVFKWIGGPRAGEYQASTQHLLNADQSVPQFRPFRTPEQLAVEEREKAIVEMVKRFALAASHPELPWRGLFAQMYDAGMRFPVESDK